MILLILVFSNNLSIKLFVLLNLFNNTKLPFFLEKKFSSPKIIEKIEGTSATIKCNTKIDRPPAITTIEWFLNGQLLSEAPPNSRRFVTSTSVMIKTLVKKDSGIYGCNRTIFQSSDTNKPNKSVVHKYEEFYLKVLSML